MPELPEVHTIVTQLQTAIVRAQVSCVHILRGDVIHHGGKELTTFPVGRTVRSVDRHGKRMAVRLSPHGIIVIHLGMSGRLTLESSDATLLKHTHVLIQFTGRDVELRFRDPRRFGGIWYYESREADPFDAVEGKRDRGLAKLGPDALTIQLPRLREILRRRRQVKALLLDQHTISGLGNIYCDEALYRAGIHPTIEAAQLSNDQVRRLARTIRSTLKSAINHGGSTLREYRNAEGTEGRFQELHRVYGRAGESCEKCRRIIVRSVVAGRTTHTCPGCQKQPVSR